MELPKRIQINEVVLRDGLQLEDKVVSVEGKKKLFDQLVDAGLKTMEIGSFVHPRLVPQMANTGDFYKAIADQADGINLITLVPNLRGVNIAQSLGVERVNFVFSASDTHNRQNVRKSTDESLKELEGIQEYCSDHGIQLDVSIATTFGCPFEGEVPPERIHYVLEALTSLEVTNITLADTTGMANPLQVYDLLAGIRKKFLDQKFNLHFHNTRGMGLTNILAGIQAGITSYDTALGGLGGCPFAPGATGNVCTEDVVHMLHSMGIETGLSLEDLLTASETLQETVGHPTPSYILKAGPYNRKYPVPKP